MANARPGVKKLQTALSLHAAVRSPERKGSHYASTGAPVLHVVYERLGLGEGSVFPRIREIIDEDGSRLRVSVAVDRGGALITLEIPDRPGAFRLVLDPLGAELLGSYIMSAGLALPHGLPDEDTQRGLTRRFRLVVAPAPVIEVTLWVDHFTSDVVTGREPIDELIGVNRLLLEGLAPQAVPA